MRDTRGEAADRRESFAVGKSGFEDFSLRHILHQYN